MPDLATLCSALASAGTPGRGHGRAGMPRNAMDEARRKGLRKQLSAQEARVRAAAAFLASIPLEEGAQKRQDATASEAMETVRSQGLVASLQGKPFVRAECWGRPALHPARVRRSGTPAPWFPALCVA